MLWFCRLKIWSTIGSILWCWKTMVQNFQERLALFTVAAYWREAREARRNTKSFSQLHYRDVIDSVILPSEVWRCILICSRLSTYWGNHFWEGSNRRGKNKGWINELNASWIIQSRSCCVNFPKWDTLLILSTYFLVHCTNQLLKQVQCGGQAGVRVLLPGLTEDSPY